MKPKHQNSLAQNTDVAYLLLDVRKFLHTGMVSTLDLNFISLYILDNITIIQVNIIQTRFRRTSLDLCLSVSHLK